MISFILNNTLVKTDKPAGMTLLDYIRYEAELKGTKIGCREGDCGACTVLEGKLDDKKMSYQTIVSCLTPLGNAHGKHIVTSEGINLKKLSPVQEALVENNGTQCGFCTPGFVMSLTCFLISPVLSSLEDAIKSMDGNICRCTGYKSIERAAENIVQIKTHLGKNHPIDWLTENSFLPEYFKTIPSKLKKIETSETIPNENLVIAGGTDLLVQQSDAIFEKELALVSDNQRLKGIEISEGYCTIGAGTVATEIMDSPSLNLLLPNLQEHFKLISSTPIRNMGTLAGNLVNASPIGDLSIFFLALNANVFLTDGSGNQKEIPLKEFFLDYKRVNKNEDELIEKIGFKLPDKETHFNFEKVSKRQFLDIASVNSAISFKLKNNVLEEVHLSAGGVSPVPLYLKATSAFLEGKEITQSIISEANSIMQEEVSPISDVRGSADYKQILLRQLLYAHFIELLPDKIELDSLLKPHLS